MRLPLPALFFGPRFKRSGEVVFGRLHAIHPSTVVDEERSGRITKHLTVEPDFSSYAVIRDDTGNQWNADFVRTLLAEHDEGFGIVRLAIIFSDMVPQFCQMQVVRVVHVRDQKAGGGLDLSPRSDHADDGAFTLMAPAQVAANLVLVQREQA